jgi:hypothetical protein
MDLATYVKLRGTGEMTRLHRRSGVSYATIHRLATKDGERLDSWKAAKKLSAATDGAVSMEELCELPTKKSAKRRNTKRGSDAPEMA